MQPGQSSRPSSSSAPRPSGPGGPKGRPGPGGRPAPGARPGGRFSPGGPGRKPPFRRKVCRVCQDKGGVVDWKAVNFLRNFVTDRGKIMPGRSRGTCAGCQRQITRAIKRARTMALMSFSFN